MTRQVTNTVDGVEQTVEETADETRKRTEPGYLESVYHLYSVEKKHGPLIIHACARQIAATKPQLPSLTPVWRGSGISGARSLRSVSGLSSPAILTCAGILMWPEFKDFPSAQRLR